MCRWCVHRVDLVIVLGVCGGCARSERCILCADGVCSESILLIPFVCLVPLFLSAYFPLSESELFPLPLSTLHLVTASCHTLSHLVIPCVIPCVSPFALTAHLHSLLICAHCTFLLQQTIADSPCSRCANLAEGSFDMLQILSACAGCCSTHMLLYHAEPKLMFCPNRCTLLLPCRAASSCLKCWLLWPGGVTLLP